jgi:hypothetical protein
VACPSMRVYITVEGCDLQSDRCVASFGCPRFDLEPENQLQACIESVGELIAFARVAKAGSIAFARPKSNTFTA